MEVARDVTFDAERLHRRERQAVAREDVADLPLRDGDERQHVHAVLERHQEVHAAAQDVGLEAGLAAQRDEARAHRAARAPPLLDDADAIVRDVARARAEQEEEQRTGAASKQKIDVSLEPAHGSLQVRGARSATLHDVRERALFTESGVGLSPPSPPHRGLRLAHENESAYDASRGQGVAPAAPGTRVAAARVELRVARGERNDGCDRP